MKRSHFSITSPFLWFLAFAVILSACQDKASRSLPLSVTSEDVPADTITTTDDELAEEETLPMPIAADELFDDFIFNFAANKRLQEERIRFPLPVNSGTKVDTLLKKQWKTDYFFMQQDFYTLIFNTPQDMERVKDTTLNEAILERIFLSDDFVRQYLFQRFHGRWMLYEVRNQTLQKNPNASFLTFYQQFATDSLFQQKSLAPQISFTGPDPDDDFTQMEGVITPDFWNAFAPELPSGMIYNIVYGAAPPPSSQRIFVVRGIANGEELCLTFQLQGGAWKLTKMNT